ncbi:UDP-N-acetylglucosamine--N-acetylmuramyl-(pentapeptide) pyrophosphoryl-undecaprenol N-acetylglucosamine transferase [Candidatus Dojkabacteria bacterium]|uniref:UDP-N-acetylglucosamine--N-acetylmuramyl-(pentapeptide) pyrophosphoryl-undecaprenol N-acetylglucosamine transferase n=1 Tax=Candidatus Dojkabacteria bacterium TaxID=2099670 RepID=A0A955RLW2_9BACT|nr:UDP-N-acetylglucosamine--N-acetylmuramyl-(pentapeptide) pyrophosphoryl-undecaprenol N-acetylglucosamine transferase [Candidatus Dojkabacteria bacterium]
MNKKRILITGGHATPAFAVLDELLKNDSLEFVWVGEIHNQRGNKNPSAEYITVIEKYQIKFVEFKSGKILRAKDPITLIKSIYELFLFIKGFFGAFFVVLATNPKVILTFGGFNAVPIAFWGRVFRKKIITHEQTVVSGLANRLIAKFADKILVSWESSLEDFPDKKTILTGNPIRADIFETKSNILKDFDSSLPVVYITGGNQGAHEINKRVFEILYELLNIANVIHQTGNSSITKDYESAIQMKERMDELKSKRYIVKEYVNAEEIGEVMNKADLLVSRAGANTVTEVLALGKPSILIPIPWTSGGEQEKNADYLASIGLGKKLIQNDSLTSAKLLNAIKQSMELISSGKAFNGTELFEAKLKAKESVNLDAAKEIASTVEAYLA